MLSQKNFENLIGIDKDALEVSDCWNDSAFSIVKLRSCIFMVRLYLSSFVFVTPAAVICLTALLFLLIYINLNSYLWFMTRFGYHKFLLI